ncbi:MipA/OmpV family protein [Vibrio sp. MA40-2]|uniref:MipA/OmpV family protein n=1 Tax=Vibrio sp. MA40-2 TaxID=3391828 RepID=UPI0039A7833E
MNDIHKIIRRCAVVSLCSAPVFISLNALSAPSPWSVGVGAAYSPKVYKSTSSNRTVIPIIGYEGEHFFFRGFSTGYRFKPRSSVHNFTIRAIYDPRTFIPNDSNDANMKLLDERRDTVLAGASYQYTTPVGVIEAGGGVDILGVHNGFYGELSWKLPIRFKLGGITPAIGYSYNDNKLNQHLYGVSQSESDRTSNNISEFDINGSGQFFVGLSGYVSLTRNLFVRGGIRYTNLEDDIEESPLLDSTVSTSANIGIAYRF